LPLKSVSQAVNAKSSALEPAAARAIIEAFEAALDNLRVKGRTLNDREMTRMAGHIIQLAENGVHNVEELTAAAVSAFAR
jgi:hypothetical protein